MIFFIAGFLCALAFVLVALECVKASINLHNSFTISSASSDSTPTDEQMKEFTEADQKATQDFLSSLADLNAFMTGRDTREEIRNVGEQ